jgi:hypothetical protein
MKHEHRYLGLNGRCAVGLMRCHGVLVEWGSDGLIGGSSIGGGRIGSPNSGGLGAGCSGAGISGLFLEGSYSGKLYGGCTGVFGSFGIIGFRDDCL